MNWPLYAIACLVYFAVNAIVMVVGGVKGVDVLWFAVSNSLPPSLLGIPVTRFYSRREERPWLVHVALALLFALLSTVGTNLIYFLFRPDEFVWRLERSIWMVLIALLLFTSIATAAHTQRVRADLMAAEASRARAELGALRARIDPHFLFNTLHSLLALVRQDPGRAEEAIEQFADILRYTFGASEGGEERTLAQEWKLVENYLALERLRLGDRLRVRESIARDVADAPLPVLTLQPLVENAVRYAVAPRAGGGTIEIRAARSERGVRIDVSDDGPGADPLQAASKNGHGLQLVRERLERMYRGAATLDLARSAEGGLRVTIELPHASARRM